MSSGWHIYGSRSEAGAPDTVLLARDSGPIEHEHMEQLRALLAGSDRAGRLAELERRHDAIWDVLLELRQAATARDLDPYKDPAAQALSAILTGRGAWQITYGTLIEARDDLDTAKARAIDLWERTKFEAEEHATDWEQRPDDSLALVAWDEEQWFDCGPVIRRLPAETEPQTETALAGTEADR